MRHQKLIQSMKSMLVLLLVLTTGQSQAQKSQNEFEKIYESVVAKIESPAALSEKLKFIQTQNDLYLNKYFKLSASISKSSPDSTVDLYTEAMDLYPKMIPLLKIKLKAGSEKADAKSCLEVQRLIMPSPGGSGSDTDERGLGGLAVEDDKTVELVSKLCGSSSDINL